LWKSVQRWSQVFAAAVCLALPRADWRPLFSHEMTNLRYRPILSAVICPEGVKSRPPAFFFMCFQWGPPFSQGGFNLPIPPLSFSLASAEYVAGLIQISAIQLHVTCSLLHHKYPRLYRNPAQHLLTAYVSCTSNQKCNMLSNTTATSIILLSSTIFLLVRV